MKLLTIAIHSKCYTCLSVTLTSIQWRRWLSVWLAWICLWLGLNLVSESVRWFAGSLLHTSACSRMVAVVVCLLCRISGWKMEISFALLVVISRHRLGGVAQCPPSSVCYIANFAEILWRSAVYTLLHDCTESLAATVMQGGSICASNVVSCQVRCQLQADKSIAIFELHPM